MSPAEWAARYAEADAACVEMRSAERRARRPEVREAYRRAGDDANEICCVMLRNPGVAVLHEGQRALAGVA